MRVPHALLVALDVARQALLLLHRRAPESVHLRLRPLHLTLQGGQLLAEGAVPRVLPAQALQRGLGLRVLPRASMQLRSPEARLDVRRVGAEDLLAAFLRDLQPPELLLGVHLEVAKDAVEQEWHPHVRELFTVLAHEVRHLELVKVHVEEALVVLREGVLVVAALQHGIARLLGHLAGGAPLLENVRARYTRADVRELVFSVILPKDGLLRVRCRRRRGRGTLGHGLLPSSTRAGELHSRARFFWSARHGVGSSRFRRTRGANSWRSPPQGK
mmetsp:Transcript_18399/g.61579  ORF Transcript_18399/g.61579 Transcript_18399/m.61579 type:complete len:273 (-) Transcript_18399:1928-2746(-)